MCQKLCALHESNHLILTTALLGNYGFIPILQRKKQPNSIGTIK